MDSVTIFVFDPALAQAGRDRPRQRAASPTASKADQGKLKDVVKEVTTSLDPSRWVDDTHLSTKKGQEVFDHEKNAMQRADGPAEGDVDPGRRRSSR